MVKTALFGKDATQEFEEIVFDTPNRENAHECYHRLPKRGKCIILDQLPVYFKVEMALSQADRLCEQEPEIQGLPLLQP